jgi:hypothetical protein
MNRKQMESKFDCRRCQRRSLTFHGVCEECAEAVAGRFGSMEDSMRHYMASFLVNGYQMVPTCDNWSGSFPGDLVAISSPRQLRDWKTGDPLPHEWSIRASGTDDMAMIWLGRSREHALAIHTRIVEPVSIQALIGLGFHSD